MTSLLELQAAKVTVGASGQEGTLIILPLDVDKIVTSANMKVGAYTIAAQPAAPCRITATVTTVATADTLGTIVVAGTDINSNTLSETITPVAGSAVSTVNVFKTITSVTGVGWVIDQVEGTADTITVGVGAVAAQPIYYEADNDRIVASANMAVGAYTVAAQPQYPTTITVTSTAAGAADTLGTVEISGLDANDTPISETVTPVSGSAVTTTQTFKTILSVVGAGWVISEGNDTIKVGATAITLPTTHYIAHIQIIAQAVVAAQTAQTGKTVADLTTLTAIPVGTYATRLTSINLTSGEGIVYLASV